MKKNLVISLSLFLLLSGGDLIAEEVIFSFFGNTISISTDLKSSELSYELDIDEDYPKKIDDSYFVLSDYDFSSVLNQLKKNANLLNVKGLDYSILVSDFVDKYLIESDHSSKLIFKWFLLSKIGFDCILFYDNDHKLSLYGKNNSQFLSVAIVEKYGKKYFDFLGQDFEKKSEKRKISIYRNDEFSSNLIAFDKIDNFRMSPNYRPLKTTIIFENVEYQFEYKVDMNLISYYEMLPDVRWVEIQKDLFSFSNEIRNTLIKEIKETISSFSKERKVNFLIRFVEQVTPYKEDVYNLGFENRVMPEEVFIADFVDCEDKSLLFAALVSEVLNCDVVLFDYTLTQEIEGHMNVGICEQYFDQIDEDWDKYNLEGDNYIVCEISGDHKLLGKDHSEYKAITPSHIIPVFVD